MQYLSFLPAGAGFSLVDMATVGEHPIGGIAVILPFRQPWLSSRSASFSLDTSFQLLSLQNSPHSSSDLKQSLQFHGRGTTLNFSILLLRSLDIATLLAFSSADLFISSCCTMALCAPSLASFAASSTFAKAS